MSQRKVKRKNYSLDENRIKRVQKLLGARTETETIELAIDEIITERERNKRAWPATERLQNSGIEVVDVFGRLEEAPSQCPVPSSKLQFISLRSGKETPQPSIYGARRTPTINNPGHFG